MFTASRSLRTQRFRFLVLGVLSGGLFLARCVGLTSASSATSYAKGAGASVPTITTQPQNQTAVVGQTATFTMTLSDPTCSVMWERNGSKIVSGLDLLSYTPPPVRLADNGAKFGAAVYNCKTA